MTAEESKECCSEKSADKQVIKEIANRIDSMLTMHSRKRDELVFRSWLLESLTVISSVAICSMTFYDFKDSESWQKSIMNVFSIISVMCSLIWLHSTSKQNAEKHQEATRQYSKLKKELEGLIIEKNCTNDNLDRINKMIAEISDIIQLSEKDFIRLKQYRKRKEYYKEHIEEYLSAPYSIALFRMWKCLRREEKGEGEMNIDYVPRKEYSQCNRWFCEKCLPVLRRDLRTSMNLKFQSMLVGSGRTKLVTGTPNGGFDLDYLFLFNPRVTAPSTAGKIKNEMMKELRKLVPNAHVEDSSSAITIRFTDPDKSSRIFGIDIVIGYTDDNGLHILKHDKHRKEFKFNLVKDSSELKKKADELHHRCKWNDVRDEYLKLKRNGKNNELCSYQIYNMAVNNVYSRTCLSGGDLNDLVL